MPGFEVSLYRFAVETIFPPAAYISLVFPGIEHIYPGELFLRFDDRHIRILPLPPVP